MAQSLYTTHGYSMFDISSLIQKALRRGDMEHSCYAACEMMTAFRPYLWKRLLVTAAEDCYDPITSILLDLRNKDANVPKTDTRFLSEAINLLVKTRKNRDADYFACNRVYSGVKEDFPMGSGLLVTRHGHDLEQLVGILKKALLKGNGMEIGYLTNEIWSWYKPLWWVVVHDVAEMFGAPLICEDIKALRDVDMKYNEKSDTTIYISKAIVHILHCLQLKRSDIFEIPKLDKVEDINTYSSHRMLPEYTYDCHTAKGRAMGKTVFDFRISEQQGLNPHHQGIYDDYEWENSTKWNKEGRNTNRIPPKLPKELLSQVNAGIFQHSLFD